MWRAFLSSKRGWFRWGSKKSGASKVCIHANAHQFAYPILRRLDGVIANLKPFSEEHALLKFLRNVDNAKTLSGFVQELADAIIYYQVWASTPTVIFNELLARFHYSKGHMRRQRTSMMRPRISTMKSRTYWWGSPSPIHNLCWWLKHLIGSCRSWNFSKVGTSA